LTHKPLLTPGIHDIAESDLDNHFLSAFAGSKTRAQLIAGFRKYISALRQVGASFEIWIDGSFATDKVDPGDIDLVLFGSAAEINQIPPEQQQILATLIDRASVRSALGCDVLFCVAENIDLRSYWRGWFGFDRDENPKGIARLEVRP
jgi:hypothetical protein